MGITEEEKNKGSNAIQVIIYFFILLSIYFGMSVYFTDHFYFGSKINFTSVSGKTVEEAKEKMASELQAYTLNLEERDGKVEQIKALDIGLRCNSDGQYKSFKESQSPFKWVLAPFNTEDSIIADGISYNTKLLKERMDKLSCFDSNNITEPKNPSFEYTDKGYVVIDEVKGNKVNKDILYDHVTKAILNGETTIDLESSNCYVTPKYTSNSPKVIETKNILNKYVSSKITYIFGNNKENIDDSAISKWLKVDEDLEVTVDEKKARNYLDVVFSNYNTVGKTRNLVTLSGKTINIGGGDYGWWINTDKEIKDLTAIIKKGQTITKEPTYIQTAVTHDNNDIGNTYVEIDMAAQHLWFYRNGLLIAQGDVVTGSVSRGHSTPQGIYRLKFKQANAILRGPDYSAHVNFWMPFNGGIGIHDAAWRSSFGGNIYRTNGSHGCVNSPYYLAKAIFDNIEEGTPVICYY